MIPAFLLVFSAAAYRITTGLLIHSGATWLSNFTPLAAIALCSAAYFPTKYKFSVPLVTLFISDAVINFSYGAPLLDSQICRALPRAGCSWMRRASPAEPSIAENPSAGFHRWIDIFLCGHKCVFVVKRSRLHKELGRSHSGADDRIAQLQRYPQLDVLPQFAHQRSLVYPALCSFHQPWPKRGGLARPSRGSARGLSRHAAGGAARRSRDALANAVDSAFRGTRQPAVSSAEDRRFLPPLHRSGSSCRRRYRCRS